MLNRLVVGTLTTLNTIMTPLGSPEATRTPTYKLEVPEPLLTDRCPGSKQSTLGLKVEEGPGTFVTVRIQGHLCSQRNGTQPVTLSMVLPSDLLDEKFLENLPENAGYVANGIPSQKHPGSRVRVKITRLSQQNNRTPVLVEWLPDLDGRTEHRPLTIWLKKTEPTMAATLPWQKIEFTELQSQMNQPLEVAGQIENKSIR